VFLAVTGKFFANIQKSQQQDKHEPDSKGIWKEPFRETISLLSCRAWWVPDRVADPIGLISYFLNGVQPHRCHVYKNRVNNCIVLRLPTLPDSDVSALKYEGSTLSRNVEIRVPIDEASNHRGTKASGTPLLKPRN
jgi:hypothetical protein